MAAASNGSISFAQDTRRVDARHVEGSTGASRDDGLSVFMRVRPRLFGIAYRILRSAAEAEDVVQEVWMRWQMTDRALVRDAVSFLATAATRLSINVMQSARARRETSVGPWLPEPVDTGAAPGLEVEQREALQAGIQLLLERLSPTARAVYILREAFGYAYRDIAAILRLREANARQLVARARCHLTCGQRTPATVTGQSVLFGAFVAAAEGGDLKRLEDLFRSQVVSTASEGRLVRARPPARLADPVAGSAALCRCAA